MQPPVLNQYVSFGCIAHLNHIEETLTRRCGAILNTSTVPHCRNAGVPIQATITRHLLENPLKTPEQLKYNKLDLWVKLEAEIATIGVTDYAQEQLSDVVFVDLKAAVGDTVKRGDMVAVVESVKASSDITAPVSGKIVEINDALVSSPELINSDPYGQAWLIKVQTGSSGELADLMDASSYQEYRNK